MIRKLVFLLALLALPAASAEAATVSITGLANGGEGGDVNWYVDLKVTAGSGEQNTFTLSREGESFRIVDTTAPVVPAAGCVADGSNAARCTVPPPTEKVGDTKKSISVTLADGDDSWTSIGVQGISIPEKVDAGPGNDTVTSISAAVDGGAGNDTLNASEMHGGDGDDTLKGIISYVSSTLDGGAGNDVLKGAGTDMVKYSGGDDLLIPGVGDDTVDGGGGSDTLSYEKRAAPVTVDLSAMPGSAGAAGEHDTIVGVENLIGTSSADRLTGNGAANVINGNRGADRINARGGDDEIEVGSIKAHVRAGAGNDFINFLPTDVDCGPGRDTFEPFYRRALRFGRAAKDGCELAQFDSPSSTETDRTLIRTGSVRVRRGRIELDVIGQGFLDPMSITLTSRGKRIAFARRIKLKGSKTGRTNRVRIPLTAAGKRRFQTARRLTASFIYQDSSGDWSDQPIEIER